MVLAALLIGLPCLAAAAPSPASSPEGAAASSSAVVREVSARKPTPIADARGITVSCWRWGYEWAEPDMRELIAILPEFGADWVAIHPYAHVSRETGEVLWDPAGRTDHLRRPIRWAHEHGLRIFIKPHLSYWGEFAWRGEIGWGADAGAPEWKRFLESYRAWTVHLARACEEEGADLFSVGTELRQAEGMESYWRGLVADVRSAYSGPLTYAANWDDFARVAWWGELDYVGVQAYFPLTAKPDPSLAARRAWATPLAELRRVSVAAGRPVLLTEVGYARTASAAARPWEARGPSGPPGLQERCLRAALAASHAAPHVAGAFIWKWFPTPRPLEPREFVVQSEEMRGVIRDAWSRGVRPRGVRPRAEPESPDTERPVAPTGQRPELIAGP